MYIDESIHMYLSYVQSPAPQAEIILGGRIASL